MRKPNKSHARSPGAREGAAAKRRARQWRCDAPHAPRGAPGGGAAPRPACAQLLPLAFGFDEPGRPASLLFNLAKRLSESQDLKC